MSMPPFIASYVYLCTKSAEEPEIIHIRPTSPTRALCNTAGITQPVHPHLFRHQMITYLTTKGLSDSQIQLISGHESKKSLEVYQHLSLKNVEQAYQDAVKSIEV